MNIKFLITLSAIALVGCHRDFEQKYAADGQPVFSSESFANFRAEGGLYPEQRKVEVINGCTVTSTVTDTPQHVFFTKYEDCLGKPEQKVAIHMRAKRDDKETLVYDLTDDREMYFDRTHRFADVDGDGIAELVVYSCLGANGPDGCRKTWLYRLNEKQTDFVNFFAVSYEKFWRNEHYIVTQAVPFTGPGHRVYEVYLSTPRRLPSAIAGEDRPVTWRNGLLFFTDVELTTGKCAAQFMHPSEGDMHELSVIPEPIRRFCVKEFAPET